MQTDSTQGSQFVLFKIGVETYAVNISETQEVLRYKAPKKIPHAPEHVLGVINLRGQIIPIVGLREKFSLEKAEPGVETRIIITHHANKVVGLVCDSVERVVFIPAKNIEEDPEFGARGSESAIRGVAHIDDEESVIFLLALSNITAEQATRESSQ